MKTYNYRLPNFCVIDCTLYNVHVHDCTGSFLTVYDNLLYRVPNGILFQTSFAKYVETKRISLLREINWSFCGIPCFTDWPISCHGTKRNETKRNDAKKYIFTELETNEVKNNFSNSHPENIQLNFSSLVL
jgi:hypothetical protein